MSTLSLRCSPGGASTSAPAAAGRPRISGSSSSRPLATARLTAAAPHRRSPGPPAAAASPHGGRAAVPRQTWGVVHHLPGRTGEEEVAGSARARDKKASPTFFISSHTPTTLSSLLSLSSIPASSSRGPPPAASASTDAALELTAENVEIVLDEVRPYLMAGECS